MAPGYRESLDPSALCSNAVGRLHRVIDREHPSSKGPIFTAADALSAGFRLPVDSVRGLNMVAAMGLSAWTARRTADLCNLHIG